MKGTIENVKGELDYLWQGVDQGFTSLFKEVNNAFFSFAKKETLKLYIASMPIDLDIDNIKLSEAMYNSFEKQCVLVKSVAPF